MVHKLIAKLIKQGKTDITALSVFDYFLARHSEFDDARVRDYKGEDVYLIGFGTHKEWNRIDSMTRHIVFMGIHTERATITLARYNIEQSPLDKYWTMHGVHDYRELGLHARVKHMEFKERDERCEPFNSFPYWEEPWTVIEAPLYDPKCFNYIETELNVQKSHPALAVLRTMLAIQNERLEICDLGYCCEDIRDHVCVPPDQQQVKACQKWLSSVPKIMKGPTKAHTSFFWSQIVSLDLGIPITEGAFIEACEGLHRTRDGTVRCHATSRSAFVNISLSTHKLYPYYGNGVLDFPKSSPLHSPLHLIGMSDGV